MYFVDYSQFNTLCLDLTFYRCNREMTDTADVHLQDASKFADACHKPSVLVPLVHATAESLIGYGTIVSDFEAEDIVRVTWPKLTGSRPIVPGTGDRQVGFS